MGRDVSQSLGHILLKFYIVISGQFCTIAMFIVAAEITRDTMGIKEWVLKILWVHCALGNV